MMEQAAVGSQVLFEIAPLHAARSLRRRRLDAARGSGLRLATARPFSASRAFSNASANVSA
jgi:hypothetical protein